jgi:tRNA(adenine34) deaminase
VKLFGADDERFMRLALIEAERALGVGEVPIGAVLVVGAQVLASGHNRSISDSDPTAHAEVVVLRAAARAQGNYRLAASTLYVTLEPCLMCAGALLHARVERLVFACKDPKAGACGSAFDVLEDAGHDRQIAVRSGVLAEPASELLRGFFGSKR